MGHAGRMPDRARLSVAQAASLLGVRVPTVYAYVSRGVLQREVLVVDGQRQSFLARNEVVALAEARARPRAGLVDAVVESDITQLDPRGRLAFRERDIEQLARLPFPEAANHVWQLDEGQDGWTVDREAIAEVLRLLPPAHALVPPVDRIRLAVQLAATQDIHRSDLSVEHVVEVARTSIHLGAAVLAGEVPEDGADLVPAVWRSLTGQDGSPGQLELLNAAFVAMMDHELASSTLAARVAASTLADPWMVLLTGLAAMSGPRHGGASVLVEATLDRWLRDGVLPDERPPGFGHKVYETIDPRCALILDRIDAIDHDYVRDLDRLIAVVASNWSVMPNVDFGLAALARWAGFPPGSAQVLFMLPRTVGLAAHALEEYPHDLRFRGRAVAGATFHLPDDHIDSVNIDN